MNSQQEETPSYAAVAAVWTIVNRSNLIDDNPVRIPNSKPRSKLLSKAPPPPTSLNSQASKTTPVWVTLKILPIPQRYKPVSVVSLKLFPEPEEDALSNNSQQHSTPSIPLQKTSCNPSLASLVKASPPPRTRTSQTLKTSPVWVSWKVLPVPLRYKPVSLVPPKLLPEPEHSKPSFSPASDLDLGYNSSSPPPSAETPPPSTQPPREPIESDCFRIDRLKLEEIMKSGPDAAALFFRGIMRGTHTLIQWPRSHKIGSHSHKNPFVKVYGTAKNKARATSLILAHLQTSGPMIKLKISLLPSQLDRIVGHNESNITRVMNETGTQIRFRQHLVGLYGSLEGVEQARAALRSLTPLVVIFKMRFTTRMSESEEASYLNRLKSKLNVGVSIYGTTVRHVYDVVVRGTDASSQRVKEAVQRLHYLGTVTSSTVEIEMEIPQELRNVFTRDKRAILRKVMKNTNTWISLADPESWTKNTRVTITGNVDGVQDAKRELLSCQPIELTFETDDFQHDTKAIEEIARKHNLDVVFRRQKRIDVLRITLIGIEQYIHQVYEAYEELNSIFNRKKQEDHTNVKAHHQ